MTMNPNWLDTLRSLGATPTPDNAEIADFGDAVGERLATRDATVLVPLTHLTLIEVQGADSKAFLHAQLTSDVNHLASDTAQHGAWCTAKGRMLASFIVSRVGEESYRLLLASELATPIAKRLQMYVLRAKVKTSNAADTHVVLGLSGPEAEAALSTAALPCPETALHSAQADAKQVIRLDGQRFLIVAPLECALHLWQQLATHARPTGLPTWRWLDVQAAFPLITAATQEEFVPQMADFEKIGGVSFHKGCYPGQEIVARTQYLGKVKRHLYRVNSPVPLEAGNDLHSPDNPDQSVGKIVSAAPAPEGGYAALAVIQANFAGNLRLGNLDGATLEAVAVNA